MTSQIVIAALYHFVSIPNPASLQEELLSLCKKNKIKGTLLVAKEGINGTVAGQRESIDTLINYLKSKDHFKELEHKESFSQDEPFVRLKVKLKKEIVTLGLPHVDPNKKVGTYVDAKDWNQIIESGIPVIDTRNKYECEIGTFKGAINPQTETFREFPDFVKNTTHRQTSLEAACSQPTWKQPSVGLVFQGPLTIDLCHRSCRCSLLVKQLFV